MRILAIHQSSDLYGSDRSFLSAISALSHEPASHQDINIILPNDGPLSKELEKLGAQIHYDPRGYLRRAAIKKPFNFIFESFLAYIRILKLVKRHDTIYINTIVCLSAILAITFTKKRKIIHVREIPTGIELKAFRILLRISGAQLIYNSAATRTAFGLPGEVIYNGVPASTRRPAEAIGSKEGRPVRVLMLGRINTWKGQDLLLSALSHTHSHLDVRIVGSTVNEQQHILEELKYSAEKLSSVHSVAFFDFTDTPDNHLAWSDYVIVPSLKPEPFGRVAIEGLAFGKPVIGSKHGGLVEIIQNCHNGFLFEPGSAIALGSLLESLPLPESQQYQSLSNNALTDYADRFSLTAYQASIKSFLLNSSST
ncbi:glycosyltransferase family 4 protein [Halopseudomonas pachastrellae]|nr:glycosyltransferase family 4 protein [Halopseudomonas pachastrellae]WVM92882.1 glycosyltransferase family 4 protein [Halopseudomonas pachastrellae]